MRKKVGIIKRVLCLCLVFLLSINSFAAIVSDNDGSAFITKAEFDALKASFQNQIDSYNQSIDSKIDGAIASYLSGIQLSPMESLMMPNANFNKITFMNYVPDNEFQFSGISLQTTILGNNNSNLTYYLFDTDKYVKTGDADKRLICDAGIESATEPDSIVWLGRSNNYIDNIQLTRIVKTESVPHFFEQGTWSPIYFNKLVAGYYSNLNNCSSSLWLGNYNWNKGGITTLTYSSYWGQTNVFSGKYDKLDLEHIVHWNTIYDLQFTDPNWDHTINYLPDVTTFNIQALKTKMTFSGYYAGADGSAATYRYKANTALNKANYYTGASGKTDTTTGTVSVGLIKKLYDSKHIKQNGDFQQDVNRKKFEVKDLDLRQGFVCFAAEKGDTITWSPKFTNLLVDGVSTSFDIDVKLAIMPFGEGDSIADTSKVIKPVGASTDYLKTFSGSCKFEFLMPDDAVVYCKCWPDDTTIRDTKKWSFDLDLVNCNDYVRTKAK